MSSLRVKPELLINKLHAIIPSSIDSLSSSSLIAASIHSAFLLKGFELVATNDRQPSSSNSTEPISSILPESLFSSDAEVFTLVYIHPNSSSIKYTVKTLKVNENQLSVHAVKSEASSTSNSSSPSHSLEISVRSYISSSESTIQSSSISTATFRDLKGFCSTIESRLIDPIAPAEPVSSDTSSSRSRQHGSDDDYLQHDPLRIPQRQPVYSNPLQIGNPIRGDFSGDLEPISGLTDPLRSGNLMGPNSFPQQSGMRPRADPGMIPRGDPLFGEPDADHLQFPSNQGIGPPRQQGPNSNQFPGAPGGSNMFGSSGHFM